VCLRLTTLHHPVPLSWNLGTLTSWNSLGHSRHVTGLIYLTMCCVDYNWHFCLLVFSGWKWSSRIETCTRWNKKKQELINFVYHDNPLYTVITSGVFPLQLTPWVITHILSVYYNWSPYTRAVAVCCWIWFLCYFTELIGFIECAVLRAVSWCDYCTASVLAVLPCCSYCSMGRIHIVEGRISQ
jgi:hypothetical protein